MTIYLISGLGADERVFQYLDFGTIKPKIIHWIKPERQETLSEYAGRLAEQIDHKSPIILGLSFGGMLAMEIAKQIPCRQVILISSAKTRHEIPLLYRIAGRLNLHQLIPVSLLKMANPFTYWLFGMRTKAVRAMLKGILEDADPEFLQWAIHAIVRWKNEAQVKGVLHFHGDNDRVLPIRNIQALDFVMPRGGHLMIYNRAATLNIELNKALSSLAPYNSKT